MSFEELREALCAWYDRGDQRAFARFERGFLRAAIAQVLRRKRFSVLWSSHGDELGQRVLIAFQDRKEAVGRDAQTVAYWYGQIGFVAMRLKKAVLQEQDERAQAKELEQVAASDGDESALIERLDGAQDARSLLASLKALSDTERLGLFVYYWHEFGQERMDQEDFDRLKRRSGRTQEEIVARLNSAPSGDIEAGLFALFKPDQIETDRGRCLDSWRKARARASERLCQSVGRRGKPL